MLCFIKYFFPLVYLFYLKIVGDNDLIHDTTNYEKAKKVFHLGYLSFGQKIFLTFIGAVNIILWILVSPIIVAIILIILIFVVVLISCLILALPLIIICSACIVVCCFCVFANDMSHLPI